jgi:hypothetical protein
MKANSFIVASIALAITGCGGGSGSLAPAVSQAPAGTSQVRTASWVSPQAVKSSNLLYVANGQYVSMYTYDNGVAGKLVGKITGLNDVQGMCTDKAGDVWIAQGEPHTVTEFAHGGKTPLASIKRGKGYATGCAVNPSNGDLAVTYNHPNAWGALYYATVYVYPRGQQPGHEYTNSTGLEWAFFLAYDDTGKLYMDGYGCEYGSCYDNSPVLMVLTPGGTAFNPIEISGAQLQNPRGLNWIKPTLLIGDLSYESGGASVGYKLLVTHSGAKVVATIPYAGTGQFWDTSVRSGDVVVPDETNSVVRTYSVSDGSLISTLKADLDHPYAAVVSQATKK